MNNYIQEMNNNYIPTKFNRDVDIYNTHISNNNNNNNSNGNILLDDREIFSKPSNANDNIDFHSFKQNDVDVGMRINSHSIMKNKKNIINQPYIVTKNDLTNNPLANNLFANNSFANNSLTNNSLTNNLLANNSLTNNSFVNNFSNINNNHNYNNYNNNNTFTPFAPNICNIEKTVAHFEHEYTKTNNDFTFFVYSPFVISYIWKIIILLSKNPSLDKILAYLNAKSKMDINMVLQKECKLLENIVTINSNVYGTNLNTNILENIKNSYNVDFTYSQQINNKNIINFNSNMNIELNIPQNYHPSIVSHNFIEYNNSSFKFIKLHEVSVEYQQINDMCHMRILLANDLLLCFVYNLHNKPFVKLPYDIMINDNSSNDLIHGNVYSKVSYNTLIIPKININKKYKYSKKFENILSNVHLGEISYGDMFDVAITNNYNVSMNVYNMPINMDASASLGITQTTIINYRCCFYVKNVNSQNKLLLCGKIDY